MTTTMTFRLADRDFTPDDCRRHLLAYNAGYYAPARASNVEADDRAYRLFDGGLARDLPTLARQLLFIGKDFGGAKVIPFDRMSAAIAERILAADGYHDVLAAQPSMEDGLVPSAVVRDLMAPFLNLPPTLGNKRNFAIWASKVLHFARLDAFPVLDSAARTALGLPAAITMPNYVERYRPYLPRLAGRPARRRRCRPVLAHLAAPVRQDPVPVRTGAGQATGMQVGRDSATCRCRAFRWRRPAPSCRPRGAG